MNFKRIIGCVGIAAVLFFSGVSARAADPFFFIQLTDTQFGMFADNANFKQETANTEFAVASINRLHPAFVVVTGDLVNKGGDAAQIAEYKRVMGKVDASIPIYNVAGNHDVGNIPTPESISTYTSAFGPDHYTFQYGDFTGIVLDSNLIQAPQKAGALAEEQGHWLEAELAKAKSATARHIVLFEHHAWFLQSATETNQYFNLPQTAREKWLPIFHQYGVKEIFCGHWHRNNVAKDGDLEVVAVAPCGKPLGKDGSGMLVVAVGDDKIVHHYYDFGWIPNKVDARKMLSDEK